MISDVVDLEGIEIFESAKDVIVSGVGLLDVSGLKLLPKLEKLTILEAEVSSVKDIFQLEALKYVQLNYLNQMSLITINDNGTQIDYDCILDMYRKNYKLSLNHHLSLYHSLELTYLK
ncbi:hypothetical protein [Fusibacter sp. JL216-2]|uniref:hypothetical protein n=1 Tax=Fusibacter sp. JL216-2 TaxID=3071453 RepID=UPI003D34E340